jgi:hypothetical protein
MKGRRMGGEEGERNVEEPRPLVSNMKVTAIHLQYPVNNRN